MKPNDEQESAQSVDGGGLQETSYINYFENSWVQGKKHSKGSHRYSNRKPEFGGTFGSRVLPKTQGIGSDPILDLSHNRRVASSVILTACCHAFPSLAKNGKGHKGNSFRANSLIGLLDPILDVFQDMSRALLSPPPPTACCGAFSSLVKWRADPYVH